MDKTIYLITIILLVALISSVLLLLKRLKKRRAKIDESLLKLDSSIKKKWDIIPEFISIIKPYAKDKLEALEKVIRLRNTTYSNMFLSKKVSVNEELKEQIEILFSKKIDNPNYCEIERKLKEIEKEIDKALDDLKLALEKYNNSIDRFPANLIAKMFNFKKVDFTL